jgi:leader peptidase (prepilin peptidase)/N-methyltransferase
LLFALVWHQFPPQAVLFLWGLLALLVAITFIDAEHLIIPTGLTWAGCVLGLAGALAWPELSSLGHPETTRYAAAIHSVVGWAVGFFGLWGVVELGKLAFGRKKILLPEPTAWAVREPEQDDQPLEFVVADESIPWWDVFSRPSDRIRIESLTLRVDGRETTPGWVEIHELDVLLPDGETLPLEGIRSLDGTTRNVTVSREAMGFGDVHLLGMIGAFFGWGSIWFSLFAASLLALIAAAIGRIGFGRPLPFGPFLAMGGLAWLFGGWKLWNAYMDFLQPLLENW